MEQLNQYAQNQEEIGQSIKKLYINMTKDSRVRKTQNYLQMRLETLNGYWKKIEENHQEMEEIKVPSHSYFTTKYYLQLKQVYDDALNYIKECPKAEHSGARMEIENEDDPEQIRRIKRQEVRIREMNKLINKARTEIIQSKQKSSYEYLRRQLQQQMDSITRLEEDIQVEETKFQSSYFEEDVYSNLQIEFFAVMEELEDIISNPTSSATRNISQYPSIPLPQIKLPVFDGSYEQWITFYDLFQKIIHSSLSLTKVEKMQYLKTYLKGEASRIIQHLHVSDNNYDAAWTLLQKRYQNNRLILSKLLDKILDLPATTTEDGEKIKQLHDTTIECLQAITNLGIPTESWGPLIGRILVRKWDYETNKLYELSLKEPNQIQDFQDLLGFLRIRFQTLEAIAEPKKRINPTQSQELKNGCRYCKENHPIHYCTKFKQLTVPERTEYTKTQKLCKNCLLHDQSSKCKSTWKCRICNKTHHTLLHRDENKQQFKSSKNVALVSTKQGTTKTNLSNGLDNEVLLATALVNVKTVSGSSEKLRILIDPGSQASFITEEAANLLAHPRQKIHAKISGLQDGSPKISKWKVDLTIHPHFPSNFNLNTTFLILSKLTQSLPNKNLPNSSDEHWKNKILADPTYNIPGPIDAIIGAEEYGRIIQAGIHKAENGLLGQNTEFGWILSGTMRERRTTTITSMVNRVEEDAQLKKFWEIEEVTIPRILTKEDADCEEHYQQNTKRNDDGRYIVKIPFKSEPQFGQSKPRAIARLLQMERRLAKNKDLKSQYHEFMEEYVHLGHMEKITSEDNPARYYIPHQAVIRPSSTTTKLRVVFDASSKTSNGISLNDVMHTGPRLQQELADILLRWRKYRIAFSADIEKMYRQIKISKEDETFQRILWRFNPSEPIQEYKLLTVTYGTTAAPYLAVKTLQQLAQDEQRKFPEASKVVLEDFYVDDLLSGADSITEAKILRQQLNEMLETGGLLLRKWTSNKPELLQSIPSPLRAQTEKEITEDWLTKSLGVYWAPLTDTFRFKVNATINENPTKRCILSEVAKLFDPLGWLAPVVIQAKLLIQELWLQELEWDEVVPENVKKPWLQFQSELKALEEINLPRWIRSRRGYQVELHGFCDASEKAYGAVIYARCVNEIGQITSILLVAKSKVAPARTKSTLPRLELCAAVLLARLFKRTIATLKLEEKTPLFAWSDSTITLAWIKGDPTKWKTFVANRVVEINKTIPKDLWRHVSGEENPADIISRGIEPKKLVQHRIWWNGPSWLLKEGCWPQQEDVTITNEERKSPQIVACVKAIEPSKEYERFSSLTKMIRVLSYCRRFMSNCSKKTTKKGTLTVEDMNTTLKMIIQDVQQTAFDFEIKHLRKNNQLDKKSKLSTLSPFIDKEGFLRVGGRLQKSPLSYDEKHPIIIPYHSHFSQLLILNAHTSTLHGGNQATLAYIRRRYWIINGKRDVRNVLHKCVKCIRYKAQTAGQLMGELPAPRVQPSPPFTHTGVDYAGPVQIRATKGRGHKSYKGYIAVFVCLSTKAIHLEAVSDMTSETFLAALKRFTARRGHCENIYSDNGTNFVGASKMLQPEIPAVIQNQSIQDVLATQGTQWHFIPPAAPHFGGIWEAGVKSVKYHLKRVIGDTTLTFEELTTLLYQIEASLNSRPLAPLSNDLNDHTVLTPGHFLIGRPLLSNDHRSVNYEQDLSSRWKLIRKITKDFWQAWSTEYLSRLQQRYKWRTPQENIKPGDVVIIKENVIDPSRWPLAKVTEVHPSDDGNVRVVTLKKSGGNILKRAIHSLVPLPVTKQEEKEPINTVDVKCNHYCVQNKSQRKRNSHNISSIFSVLLLVTIILNSVTASYNIKYPKPGLYIEHLGHTKIERGLFRIETKVNKTKMDEDMKIAAGAVQDFKLLCDNITAMGHSTHCHTLLHHLEEENKQLEWVYDGFNNVIHRREKRGLLGRLLTNIFGVNEEVYQDIEALEKNQQMLIKASNHQTKFMMSALSTFNATETRVYAQLEKFHKKLDDGLYALHEMDHWYKTVDINQLNIYVLNSYHMAVNIIAEISNFYSKVMHLHLGKGDLYDIMPPAHVHKLVATANSKLPSNIQILQSPIVKIRMEQDKDFVTIFTYFSMAEVTEFDIIKVNTIPLKITNSTYWVLEVPNEIIAIDYNNQLYFQLSHEEFNECISVEVTQYLCAPTSVKSIESNPGCVISEIYRRSEDPSCGIQELPINSIIWKQLYMKNTWIFITPKPEKIAIICSGIREDVLLNITGVLKISQNCVIKTKQIILSPKRDNSITVTASFNHPVAIPTNFTMKRPLVIQGVNEEKVIKAGDEVSQLIAQEEQITDEIRNVNWHHVKHHPILISVLTTVTIAIAIITTWGLYCYCMVKCKRQSPPQDTTNGEEGIPLQTISRSEVSSVGGIQLQPIYAEIHQRMNSEH